MKKQENTTYAFYSKVLKEVFDSVEELHLAEEAYYAKLKAKEDKAAEKKADALKVEEAFKQLNVARKQFKTNLNDITEVYREDLNTLKAAFEQDRADVYAALAKAEETYSNALKTFAEKYPEGYHITLKDGDFETTISKEAHASKRDEKVSAESFKDIFDLIFRF